MKKMLQTAASIILAALMMFIGTVSRTYSLSSSKPRSTHADFVNVAAFAVPVDADITLAETTEKSDTIENAATRSGSNLQHSMKIVFADNRLSVSLEDVYLEDVLKEISRKTNVKIIGKGAPNKKISLKFIDLPLEEGFKRILKDQNYSFTYLKKEGAAADRPRFVISHVAILGSSSSSQVDNKRSGTASKTTSVPSPNQPLVLPDISAETINRILTQAPQAQEDALKSLAEAINRELPSIYQQLQEMIEQSGELGENSIPPEVLQKLLPESEIKKIQE